MGSEGSMEWNVMLDVLLCFARMINVLSSFQLFHFKYVENVFTIYYDMSARTQNGISVYAILNREGIFFVSIFIVLSAIRLL